MIDSVAGASMEEDSGSFPPLGEDTPSQSATLEPDKSDRAERPHSSEYSSELKASSQPLLLLPFEGFFRVCHLSLSSHLPFFFLYLYLRVAAA